MSAQTVDVVRSVYDNFAKGDIPAVLATLAPSLEWVEGSQGFLPHHGTHRTPAAVADKVFGMVAATFEEFAVVPERFHDAGDTVVVEGRAVGVTKTGRRLDAPACWVWTVHDRHVTANHNYHDTDAWREALGHPATPGTGQEPGFVTVCGCDEDVPHAAVAEHRKGNPSNHAVDDVETDRQPVVAPEDHC